MTKAAIERMHASPEEAFQLAQRVRQSFEKVRAKTKAMQAGAPAPAEPVSPEEAMGQLDARETKAQEDLNAELAAAKQKVSDDIAQQYADRIASSKDVATRKHNEQLAETARVNRLRGLEREFAVKRKALAQDFTRQRQVARAKARDVSLRASQEGKQAAAKLEHVRAFSELNALISALPPELRGLVGGTTTLAQLRGSGQSIEKFLAARIEQMDKLMEEHYQKVYRERIETLLKRKLPKRATSGVKKSTIGADAQDVVNRVAVMVKTPIEEVAAKVRALEARLVTEPLTPEQESQIIFEQNEWNTFGDISQMTATQLEAAMLDLANTVKQGQAAWGAQEEARIADYRRKATDFVRVLPPATEPGAAAQKEKVFSNWLRSYARNHSSFVQIIDRLFPGAFFNEEWESKAIANDQTDMAYVRDVQKRLADTIGRALGTKSQWSLGGALADMRVRNIPVPGGTASKGQAIQYLFAWGQPKVQERMIKHGWTEEHIQRLRDATADPVSQAMMQFLPQGYEEIYQKADPIYVAQYGMHLPRIEGQYAPMRHRVAGSINEMSATGGTPTSGITPTALRSRVDHNNELLQVDALDVFLEHLMQMSHWIHFAPFIRETRSVLGNAKVKQALEQQIGRDGVGDLQKHLDTITRNGVTRSLEVSGTNTMMNRFTQGVAVSGLAFNLHTGVIQGDSALRWMTAIPMSRWGRAFLVHKWLPLIPEMWKSPAVQNRVIDGMNPAMQAVMKGHALSPHQMVVAVNAGFWHLRYIDGALTSVSSAIVYADAIHTGLGEEVALQKMSEAVAKFSQPTLSVSKSQELLTAGPAKRMLLLFMADPTLKTSLIWEGLMNIDRGRRAGDWSKVEEGFRAIIAVEFWSLTSQVLLNTWATLFSDDDDEEIWDYRKFIRAAAAAPLQGWFVAGNIAEGVLKWMADEKWYIGQTAPARFAENIRSLLNNWDDIMLLRSYRSRLSKGVW